MRRAERIVDVEVGHRGEPPYEDGLFGLFRFQGQVLLGGKPEVLEHQDISALRAPDSIAGAPPEYIVHVGHRAAEQPLELRRVRFKRRVILLAGPALVREDDKPRILECLHRRQVLPKPLVV